MKKITIIFGTEMGTAEGCALQISMSLTACNLENEVVDMAEYDHARLLDQGLLIVATSTTGNGVPPSNARALHAHLATDKPDLSGLHFAVLSLGDSFRMHFAQCGKDFDRMLEELGGIRIIDRIDSDGVVEGPLKQFQNNLLDYFEGEGEQYPMFKRQEEVPEPNTKGVPQEDKTIKASSPSGTAKKRSIFSRVKRRLGNKIRRLFT